MKTTFSSLLEHIETFPVNAEVNKKEEELYCATAFSSQDFLLKMLMKVEMD